MVSIPFVPGRECELRHSRRRQTDETTKMNALIDMLKRHEGVREFAYRCSADKITIGCGRNIDEDGGLGLNEDEIEYLLRNDIIRCERELTSAFPWFKRLDDVRKDAMIDICFNLGITRLRGFQKALAHMAEGDFILAANEFKDSR